MYSKKFIMGIMQENRTETAHAVQEILTRFGCVIKTRLGLHQADEDKCSSRGLILIEFTDHADKEVEEMEAALSELKGVQIRVMEF